MVARSWLSAFSRSLSNVVVDMDDWKLCAITATAMVARPGINFVSQSSNSQNRRLPLPDSSSLPVVFSDTLFTVYLWLTCVV